MSPERNGLIIEYSASKSGKIQRWIMDGLDGRHKIPGKSLGVRRKVKTDKLSLSNI